MKISQLDLENPTGKCIICRDAASTLEMHIFCFEKQTKVPHSLVENKYCKKCLPFKAEQLAKTITKKQKKEEKGGNNEKSNDEKK